MQDYLIELKFTIELSRAKLAEELRLAEEQAELDKLAELNKRALLRRKFAQQEAALGAWHAQSALGDLGARIKRETDKMNRSRPNTGSSRHSNSRPGSRAMRSRGSTRPGSKASGRSFGHGGAGGQVETASLSRFSPHLVCL